MSSSNGERLNKESTIVSISSSSPLLSESVLRELWLIPGYIVRAYSSTRRHSSWSVSVAGGGGHILVPGNADFGE